MNVADMLEISIKRDVCNEPSTDDTKPRIKAAEQLFDKMQARFACSFVHSPSSYNRQIAKAPDGAPQISPVRQMGTSVGGILKSLEKKRINLFDGKIVVHR